MNSRSKTPTALETQLANAIRNLPYKDHETAEALKAFDKEYPPKVTLVLERDTALYLRLILSLVPTASLGDLLGCRVELIDKLKDAGINGKIAKKEIKAIIVPTSVDGRFYVELRRVEEGK